MSEKEKNLWVEKWLKEYKDAAPGDKKKVMQEICNTHPTLLCRIIVQLKKCKCL